MEEVISRGPVPSDPVEYGVYLSSPAGPYQHGGWCDGSDSPGRRMTVFDLLCELEASSK